MSEPYPDATAQNVMFGATGSVAAFYAEGSYGLTTHTGSITPWLTVSSNKPTTCDISSYSQARTLAKSAGYDPANYNLVVYVFPRIPCGWAGLGSVGGQGAWINQALSTYVVSHELGHNYGLLHAHSWDCGATAIGPTCTRSEYGDPFDTMGNALRQFNAPGKASILAWLTGGSIATRSSGSATYTLSPLESGSGLRALQLPTSVSGRTYWVEFRQATGFDSGLSGNANVMNGALIHLAPSAVGGTDLLDMTPGTSGFSDAALDVGNAFTDPAAGLTITTVSKSGSTLDVRVDFAPVRPTASFYFLPVNLSPGQTVTFSDTSSGPPTSWNWNFGDSATSTQQNPTHAYATGGTYTVTLTASNALGASAPVSHTIIVGTPPPTISSLVASPTLPRPVGTTITWTATATGGVAPLQYEFLLYTGATGTWSVVRAYSTANTWAWTPPQTGQYAVQVWVKNNGSVTAYDAWTGSGFFNITAAGGAPTISSLTAIPTLPQQAGTPITWTATATGGVAPLQYQFLLYTGATATWSVSRAHSTTNTWSWTPSQAGQYAVQVWVKSNGSAAAYDAWKGSGLFNITSAGGPLTISSLTASPALPQRAGTAITWTAMASGGTAPLQYEFLLYSGASGTWSVARAYSTSNTWSWTPSQAGQYAVQVWVKNNGSVTAYDAWKGSGFFTISP